MKKIIQIFTKTIPWLCGAFIATMAYIFLFVNNSDTLFMAQSQSAFFSGCQFFRDCMADPGGLLAWLGCWLTQLFYTPWQGATALTAIWLLAFYMIKRAYSIRGGWSAFILIPVLSLLVSVIDLGYWIYYIKQSGYFFRESLGVLSVALLAWGHCIASSFAEKHGKVVRICTDTVAAIIIGATYPLIGFYALVALASIIVRHLATLKLPSAVITALITIATPLLFAQIYTTMLPAAAFLAGFPVFESNLATSTALSRPFIVIMAWFAICPLLGIAATKIPDKWNGTIQYVLTIAIAALCYHTAKESDYNDENYHAEMQMYRSVEDMDWDATLATARSIEGDATRQIVVLKNIALLNTGNIGDQLYRYNNMGEQPHTRDSLMVRMFRTAGPLIYLHHGKINYAYRWCIENSVEYGASVSNLKTMSLCALVNGENELAAKYLDMLSRTMNHKEWAEHYRPITQHKKSLKDYPELRNICEMHAATGSRLDTDQGICEIYLLNYFSNTMSNQSKYFQEVTLAYALMSKDIQKFWQHFFLYAELHKGETMPIHYQEAAYLYGILEPQTVNTSGMPFDEERIRKRYTDFDNTTKQLLAAGMSVEQVGRQTKSQFGDTFWWDYFFVRDIHSY